MDEIRYLISDASKKVDVETHVLRYWEEELGLSIPRNEMGHRYYTEFHIRLFCQVKELKEKGYQLKAIKNALQQVMNRNREVVETEDVLEQDITKTLEKNPRLGVMYRISVDRSAATRAVIEKQIGPREQTASNVTNMSDYSRLEEKQEQADVAEEIEKEEILEREEKDGQTDMKSRRKDRRKPSAWERRNGVVMSTKEKAAVDEGRTSAEKTGEEEKKKPLESVSEEIALLPANTTEVLPDADAEAEDRTDETALAVGEDLESSELSEVKQMTPEEKMEQFQMIMNHIISRALEENNEKLSREISGLVNQKIAEDLEDLMRIRDEREEERFRQLDETIRSCQRMSQGKAEAAAAKVPFLKKHYFGRI